MPARPILSPPLNRAVPAARYRSQPPPPQAQLQPQARARPAPPPLPRPQHPPAARPQPQPQFRPQPQFQAPAQPQTQARFQPQARPSVLAFQYTGPSALTAIGPLSGRQYRFPHPGAVLQVDPRDRASLAAVPHLRQV